MSTQDNNTPSNSGGLFSDKAFSKEANDTPISTSSPAAVDANPKVNTAVKGDTRTSQLGRPP